EQEDRDHLEGEVVRDLAGRVAEVLREPQPRSAAGFTHESARQRRRNWCAASFGRRSRVKTPFLFPSTRITPGTVAKSAKFQMCSPTTASNRSNTRWNIASRSAWYSSDHIPGTTSWTPGIVSAPYSVKTIGLSYASTHAAISASSSTSALARSPGLA